MWTLGGRYLQTVGTFKPWKKIEDNGLSDDFDYSIPPDIKRIASSTTLRVSEWSGLSFGIKSLHQVLCGGSFPKRLTIKQLQKQAQKDLVHIDHSKIYGNRLKDPILGEYYQVPERTTHTKDIKFDTSFPHVNLPNPNLLS